MVLICPSPEIHIITYFQYEVRLPDVEFYINVGDWPMETRKQMTFLGLFQSSPGAVPQTPETSSSPPMTTLTPPWRPWVAFPMTCCQSRATQVRHITSYILPWANSAFLHLITHMHITLFPWPLGPPWSNKTEQALFCGRDSREERLHLVTLSKKNPELRDARITGWFFFREREKDLGKANLVGFFDFFKVGEHSEHSTQSQQVPKIKNW